MTSVEPAVELIVEPVPLDLGAVLPARAPRRDSLRLAGSFLIVLMLHALIFLVLAYHAIDDMPPIEEIIPVEVIVEPQPPEQPVVPETEPERTAEQNFDFKPATDAPRASDEDRAGQATSPAPEQKPQEPLQKAPDIWGLQTQLPPLVFEMPAPKSRLMKGQAERSYSSVVYAMIMENLSLPEKRKPGRAHVRVSFGVDSAGHVFQSAVTMSSADSTVDGAVLDAVRKATPLPPPPGGGPIYLYFEIETN